MIKAIDIGLEIGARVRTKKRCATDDKRNEFIPKGQYGTVIYIGQLRFEDEQYITIKWDGGYKDYGWYVERKEKTMPLCVDNLEVIWSATRMEDTRNYLASITEAVAE
jgi:hypothetical protein